MVDFMTVLLSLISAVIGSLLAHSLTLRKINKETFFKKKFEYFEKIGEDLERETKEYHNLGLNSLSKHEKSFFKTMFDDFKKKRQVNEKKFKFHRLDIFRHGVLVEFDKYVDLQKEFYQTLEKLAKGEGDSKSLYNISGSLISQQNKIIAEIKSELKTMK